MEKNVKIQLPKKYSVGIEVLVPIKTNQAIERCQKFMAMLSALVGNGRRDATDFERVLRTGGKTLISIPFIRSIAEMKVDGLNNAFDKYGILLKAYLEQED
jgi:hypothetical protein